jgi:hypothetical protein
MQNANELLKWLGWGLGHEEAAEVEAMRILSIQQSLLSGAN